MGLTRYSWVSVGAAAPGALLVTFRFFLSLYALAVQGLFHVTFLFAQKSNQKSALKNYVLKNLLNVPLQKSRGTCAKRKVSTFDMERFFKSKGGLVRHCQHGFIVA